MKPSNFTTPAKPQITGCLVALVLLAGCGREHRFVTRAPDARPSCVIRNVRVFDAPHAALLDGVRDVVVRDGRIAAVAPPGITVSGLAEIDGRGDTLLPGLPPAVPRDHGRRLDDHERVRPL